MTDYAKSKGVKLADIKKAIKDEIIHESVFLGGNDRKLIKVNIANPLWDEHFKKDEVNTKLDFPKHAPGRGHREGSEMVKGESSPLYSQARASKEVFAAKMAQIKYEEMVGSYVKVEDIKEAAQDIGRNLRDAMLNIPNKLSPILAAESDLDAINKLLTDEITSALENLSRGDYDFLNDIMED